MRGNKRKSAVGTLYLFIGEATNYFFNLSFKFLKNSSGLTKNHV